MTRANAGYFDFVSRSASGSAYSAQYDKSLGNDSNEICRNRKWSLRKAGSSVGPFLLGRPGLRMTEGRKGSGNYSLLVQISTRYPFSSDDNALVQPSAAA